MFWCFRIRTINATIMINIITHPRISRYWKYMSKKQYLMPSQQPLYSSPLDKMADNLQTILSGAFLWMKNLVFWLLFYWSLFLRVQWTLNQYWLRQWLGAKQVPSHYLNQCSVDSLMHICSTRGRWVRYELVNKKTPFIGKNGWRT